MAIESRTVRISRQQAESRSWQRDVLEPLARKGFSYAGCLGPMADGSFDAVFQRRAELVDEDRAQAEHARIREVQQRHRATWDQPAEGDELEANPEVEQWRLDHLPADLRNKLVEARQRR